MRKKYIESLTDEIKDGLLKNSDLEIVDLNMAICGTVLNKRYLTRCITKSIIKKMRLFYDDFSCIKSRIVRVDHKVVYQGIFKYEN